MDTRIGTIYPDMFPQGHTTWNTVYLDGLDTSYGSVDDNGLSLDFYGTVKNDNIIMCGLGCSSLLICKGDYFTFGHMVSSFLEKFNSQSVLRNWLCIKMSMKKAD